MSFCYKVTFTKFASDISKNSFNQVCDKDCQESVIVEKTIKHEEEHDVHQKERVIKAAVQNISELWVLLSVILDYFQFILFHQIFERCNSFWNSSKKTIAKFFLLNLTLLDVVCKLSNQKSIQLSFVEFIFFNRLFFLSHLGFNFFLSSCIFSSSFMRSKRLTLFFFIVNAMSPSSSFSLSITIHSSHSLWLTKYRNRNNFIFSSYQLFSQLMIDINLVSLNSLTSWNTSRCCFQRSSSHASITFTFSLEFNL